MVRFRVQTITMIFFPAMLNEYLKHNHLFASLKLNKNKDYI